MTKDTPWADDSHWCITINEKDLPDFHPYFTGNGRLGVRVGSLVLDWGGESRELLCEDSHDFWGRLNARLLITLAKFGYDGGEQLVLPAWNQLQLEIAGVCYREENGRHHLRNVLDLRNGEVTLEDVWEYSSGRTVTVRVRLVVPRSRPCASWFELELDGLLDPAFLRFGLNASQVAGDYERLSFSRQSNVLRGEYVGRRQGREFVQGLAWEASGWKEAGERLGKESAWISLAASGPKARVVITHSVQGAADFPEPERRVAHDLRALDSFGGRDRASEESNELWQEIWANGLAFQHENKNWERLVLANQFHLLANLDETGRYALGPLGLSRPGWHGSQMWDADFWVFRGVLPLWPRLACSIVGFRKSILAAAEANAKKQGYQGAFFPWLCTDEGVDMASPTYRKEIHNNVWIGLAAWEAAQVLDNEEFLTETAWPILSGVADFFVSRAEHDADGSWHVRGVLPPDESVAEAKWSPDGTCNDNVLTNVGVRTVLLRAIEAARMTGQPVPPEWNEVAQGIVVLPAGADGVIPEYDGYSGHKIKQADTILAFYPLNHNPGLDITKKTLAYYHERTDRGGPLMTVQIEALLTMRLGDRERGLEHLFNEYSRYVRGPHYIPFETPSNANSIMLTGIGGMLQALIFGWYGAELDNLDSIPRFGHAGRSIEAGDVGGLECREV
jgi:trehalose/maltose hydrolase-like predicted phosphorylase